jgi:AcrR family transcriptional regulator
MGKRMSADDRREQILQGATRLFAEKGFRGTTTRELAEHLAISEALMFKYFPSKEALYRAIIEKQINGDEDVFYPKEAIQSKNDRQVFQSVASYLIRKNTQDPNFMRLLLYSALEGHELSKIFTEGVALKNTRLLSEYIRQRIEEKAFKDVPPLLAARAFIGMVIHYILSQEVYGMKGVFHFSHKKVVDTFVDAFLNGLQGGSTGSAAQKGRTAGKPS